MSDKCPICLRPRAGDPEQRAYRAKTMSEEDSEAWCWRALYAGCDGSFDSTPAPIDPLDTARIAEIAGYLDDPNTAEHLNGPLAAAIVPMLTEISHALDLAGAPAAASIVERIHGLGAARNQPAPPPEHWVNLEAYRCPACSGPVYGLVNGEGESLDEPPQCINLACAAVIEIDMGTGEWRRYGFDYERASRAGGV